MDTLRTVSDASDISEYGLDGIEDIALKNMRISEDDGNPERFQFVWNLLKGEIFAEELKALRQRQDAESQNFAEDNVIRYHYGSAGHYTFLSENYRCSIPFYYDGKYWRTAQHAYQSLKFSRQHSHIREEIALAPEPRDAKSIAKKYRDEMVEGFEEGWVSRECMYDVLCHKFNLRGPEKWSNLYSKPDDANSWLQLDLALRLMNTRGKPIYHIAQNQDQFWGTLKVPNSLAEIQADGNWNGRILAVIRHKLWQEYTVFLEKRGTKLNREIQRSKEAICPIPEGGEKGFLQTQIKSKDLSGSTVAGRFLVIKPKVVPGGSYSGACYLCEDKRATVDALTHIKTFLTERISLSPLREWILNVIKQLIAGTTPAWGDLFDDDGILNKVERDRFPNQEHLRTVQAADRPWARSLPEYGLPDWWLELRLRLEKAKQDFDAGRPLLAAHDLRALLNAPPTHDSGKTVFLKTFRSDCTEERVRREIMHCSSKTPDLTTRDDRERLCNHEGLSAILGASHAGVVAPPPQQQHALQAAATLPAPARATVAPDRVAFVALEYCSGIDLFDLCYSVEWNRRCRALLVGQGDPSHLALIRAISHQISMAVAHLHRSGVTHGDLKCDNIMVSPSGRVRLIDYGYMNFNKLTPGDDVNTPYSCPEMFDVHPDGAPEELLKKNDTWMLGHVHVVLFVGLKHLRQDRDHRYYGQGEGAHPKQTFIEWLESLQLGQFMSFKAAMELNLPKSLALLQRIFVTWDQRCVVREPLSDKWWELAGSAILPTARSVMPYALADFFVGEHSPEGDSFAPDLLVVPCEHLGGWLVARPPEGSFPVSAGGQACAPLEVGDLILPSNLGWEALPEPEGWLGEFMSPLRIEVKRRRNALQEGNALPEELTLHRLVDVRELGNLLHRGDRLGDGAAAPASVPFKFRVAFARRQMLCRHVDTVDPTALSASTAGELNVAWEAVESSWTEFEAYMGESGLKIGEVLQIWVERGWAREPILRGQPIVLRETFQPVLDEARRRQIQTRAEVEAELQTLLIDPDQLEVRLKPELGKFGRFVAYEFLRQHCADKLDYRKESLPDGSTALIVFKKNAS